MKAATIAVRIADFLKQHPPFQFFADEDLIALARAGRVRFHEAGEWVFQQGHARDGWIYALQKGRVHVIEHTPKGERLIDIRSEGEILGLQGLLTEGPYIHSARTEADTILYALPRAEFVRLARLSQPATRYLAAYFTLNPTYEKQFPAIETPGLPAPASLHQGGITDVSEPHAMAREALVTVPADMPVREAARLLASKRIDCLIITDAEGRPVGKLTDADIRNRVVDGSLRRKSTVGEVMYADIVPAKPTDNTGRLLVRMTRAGKHFLIVTEDGTLNTRAIGLVSERGIFLQYGRFPTLLGEAMSCAADIQSLRRLRDRLEVLILEFLEQRSALSWLMELTGVLNRKLTSRILQLSRQAMQEEGWKEPKAAYCWLMMGSGGRDELLIRSAVYHALVYEDPEPGVAPATRAYYLELARRTAAGLRQCGFLESEQGVLAHRPQWCLSFTEMKRRYSEFIANPEGSQVYEARDAFDFRPVVHKNPLSQALREHIRQEIAAHPDFIRHMANDSLLNQPPITFYRDYVVAESGARSDDLYIKTHALLPLVDMARVFALGTGKIISTATYRRLEIAAAELEARGETDHARLLREAANAFLVAAHVRTRSGLTAGTDGAVIKPIELEAESRNLLKTAFRTIMDTLECTALRHGLTLRQ